MEEGSGGLLTNGTKIRSGGLPKNGKIQRFDWVDFRRSEKGELGLGWVSEEWKKKAKIRCISWTQRLVSFEE
ncbi:unnamed protein product [Rhizophagus irregularis]|nr:unnamed protein product [Rhizophagus irregularis]